MPTIPGIGVSGRSVTQDWLRNRELQRQTAIELEQQRYERNRQVEQDRIAAEERAYTRMKDQREVKRQAEQDRLAKIEQTREQFKASIDDRDAREYLQRGLALAYKADDETRPIIMSNLINQLGASHPGLVAGLNLDPAMGQADVANTLGHVMSYENEIKKSEMVQLADGTWVRAEDALGQKGKMPSEPLVKAVSQKSPTGFEWFTRSGEGTGMWAPSSGVDFEVTPEGGVRVRTGEQFTVGTQTQAAESVKYYQEAYPQIQEIETLIDQGVHRRALSYLGRIGINIDEARAKLQEDLPFVDLDEGEVRELRAATNLMSRATNVYANYLFGRGGKNLTKNEKQTLQGMMARVGEGWTLTGFDSPVAFEQKLERLKEYFEIAMVRDVIRTQTDIEDAGEIARKFPHSSEQFKAIRDKIYRDSGVPNPHISKPGGYENLSDEELTRMYEERGLQ